jgi:integrase
MTISPGLRFEATQALRQVLARAVVWGMIDSNPAKQGVDNPQRRRTEKRPFDSWAQLDEVAVRLGSRYGPPVLFAAATGLRPGEWMALEQRDIEPPSTSRLRPSRPQRRPAQEHEDRGEHLPGRPARSASRPRGSRRSALRVRHRRRPVPRRATACRSARWGCRRIHCPHTRAACSPEEACTGR